MYSRMNLSVSICPNVHLWVKAALLLSGLKNECVHRRAQVTAPPQYMGKREKHFPFPPAPIWPCLFVSLQDYTKRTEGITMKLRWKDSPYGFGHKGLPLLSLTL